MFSDSPEAIIRETDFDRKTVDIWIPFGMSAEGMEDTDKTRDKVSAFIDFMKKTEYDTVGSPKRAVKEDRDEEYIQFFDSVFKNFLKDAYKLL